jgi:carbamoyl-phosphate synthase small subunit
MSAPSATLALENGLVIRGTAIGAIGAEASGELVFNTAMSGYQEIMTDPSYSGQIVTFTYPHIGNYGVNESDVESDRIQAAGLVVRELSRVTSNYRATASLQSYLETNGIAGIEDVDTRMIVRVLRDEGAMRCVIVHDFHGEDAALVARARAVPSMNGLDLTGGVTTKQAYTYTPEQPDDFGYGAAAVAGAPSRRYKVAAIDFGIKRNILRRLAAYGCDVTVFPSTVTADEIRVMNPDGIFLSNGPGDPAAVTHAIETVKGLLGYKPIFGICLGHQIMALAVGAKTYKLKFGHRGANHPVKNLLTGSIEISSQNHGFAVDPDSLPSRAEVTHLNLNDNTVSGLRLLDVPAFCVQYHPEASPGPHDSDYLFEEFVGMMNQ